ncbi:MAG: hypothetical protein LUD22_00020 [Coprobacillus sp.]|nr:hypothetical protein [Coprobacillus sp.]
MPKISFSKFLSSRSKRKSTKTNSGYAQKTIESLNNYFIEKKYPFKVIDSILSVYVITFLVEPIASSQEAKLEDTLQDLKELLETDNIRLIDNVLNTSYLGLQVANPSPFDLSYQYCLDNTQGKGKLPIGIDTTNQLLSLTIDELGNTLVIGGPKTRKTTFIKTLLTSLILSQDNSDINVILDNSYYHDLSLFSKNAYMSNDIILSLNHLVKELDRREALLNGETFKSYNKKALNDGINTLPRINIFLDEYKNDYLNLVYNLVSRSSRLGLNIILSSSTYIPELGKYLSSCLIFKVDDLESAHLTNIKDALYLIGKGDALILSNAIKREDPLRIVTPYISDKDIRRLVP